MKKKEVIKILEENKITNVTSREPKIIHTKEFYCDGSENDYEKHPRVHYTFNNKIDSTDKIDKGYVVCEYCYAKFIYKEKDFYDKAQEEKKLLDMSMKESNRQRDERTPSEKMQDELEPINISCPMDEYYDDDEINDVEKRRKDK
jgi:uncharacterized Zn-finger protein